MKAFGRKQLHSLLVVEDNPGDTRLLYEMFAEADIGSDAITHVRTMKDAERHLVGKIVDIVLLDLGLPDAQGMERVLRTRTAAPTVPLVVFTGSDDERLALEAMQSGAQDYLNKGEIDSRGLAKPFKQQDLHQAIRRVVGLPALEASPAADKMLVAACR